MEAPCPTPPEEVHPCDILSSKHLSVFIKFVSMSWWSPGGQFRCRGQSRWWSSSRGFPKIYSHPTFKLGIARPAEDASTLAEIQRLKALPAEDEQEVQVSVSIVYSSALVITKVMRLGSPTFVHSLMSKKKTPLGGWILGMRVPQIM